MIDLYFYDSDYWQAQAIKSIYGGRYNHVVPALGDHGLHVYLDGTRWIPLAALHRVQPAHSHLSIPVKTLPIDLIEETSSSGEMSASELTLWYQLRGTPNEFPQPYCCVTAVKEVLLLCGVSLDGETPDEIFREASRMSNNP